MMLLSWLVIVFEFLNLHTPHIGVIPYPFDKASFRIHYRIKFVESYSYGIVLVELLFGDVNGYLRHYFDSVSFHSSSWYLISTLSICSRVIAIRCLS